VGNATYARHGGACRRPSRGSLTGRFGQRPRVQQLRDLRGVSVRFITNRSHTGTTTPGFVTMAFNVHPKHPASRYTFTVIDSTPTSGIPFTVNMTGGLANTAIILTVTVTSTVTSTSSDGIAGAKAFTATRDASSAAAWTVTSPRLASTRSWAPTPPALFVARRPSRSPLCLPPP